MAIDNIPIPNEICVFCSKFINWCGQTAAKDGEDWLESNLRPDNDGSANLCICLPVIVKQQQKVQGDAPALTVQHIALSEMERLQVIHSQNFENVAENLTLFKWWKLAFYNKAIFFFIWLFRVVSQWHLENQDWYLIMNIQCCYIHLVKLEMYKRFLIMSSGKMKFPCTECLYINWIKRSVITSVLSYMGLPLNKFWWTYY